MHPTSSVVKYRPAVESPPRTPSPSRDLEDVAPYAPESNVLGKGAQGTVYRCPFEKGGQPSQVARMTMELKCVAGRVLKEELTNKNFVYNKISMDLMNDYIEEFGETLQ